MLNKKCYISLLLILMFSGLSWSWGSTNHQKVLLRDVQVLTLRQGEMTTGRRSSPVPQLKCVGGSAQGMFNPEVVQCYNRGWDGLDVQWECKTDLDMDYRLGSVSVVCEGFDHPDDPYILAGSCGLEYSLELTQQGRQKRNSNQNSGQSSYYYKSQDYNNNQYGESQWKGLSDLILFGVVAIVVYAMYKTCISNDYSSDRQYSSTNDDGSYPDSSPGAGGWNSGLGGSNGGSGTGYYGDNASCGGTGGRRQAGTGAGGAGNFWAGAGVGGLLGYMFGARNNTYGGYNRGYYNNYGTYGYNRWGGGGGGGWSGGSGSGFSASSMGGGGTRTASGFGGTRRR